MSIGAVIVILVLIILMLFSFRTIMRRRSIPQFHPADLGTSVNDPAFLLLDVRTHHERNQNHIRGSLHIPLHELLGRLSELDRYKDRRIICYCQSGSRSISAASLLGKQGFSVANLRGGIAEWNYHHLKRRQ